MKSYFTLHILVPAILCILLNGNVQAQKFWLTTYEFPNGPKTGLIQPNDNNMLTSYRYGVLHSVNEGTHFEQVLQASSVFTLFSSKSGRILAGGPGKVFRSLDQGQTWDSTSLNTIYPIMQFTETPQGHLFAITGVLDIEQGYIGDGVFYSNDQGETWAQRNSGLGNYSCCERITCDKNGRIYLTVADEYVSGNGGLFVSDDNGLSWQHIDIRIDGKNAISNEIKVANTTGLTVTPDDSLIVSLSGIAVNTLVQLNIKKSIADIGNDLFWKPFNISNTNSWWYDRMLGNIYFAINGDQYSSVPGSMNAGGTYLLKKGNTAWQRLDYGLGLDMNGTRNYQYFTENSSGRIFMIQMLDERIYWTDESLLTSVPVSIESKNFTIFPNPVRSGETVNLRTNKNLSEYQITVYDSSGKVVHSVARTLQNPTIVAPSIPGIYLIMARKLKERLTSRFMVSPQ